MAVTLSAYWHLWHVGQGWTSDNAKTFSTVESLCLRAIELDAENSNALGIYAYTLAWKKQFDRSVDFFDRSLRLNPNLAYIWALSAATYCYLGEPENALNRLNRYRDRPLSILTTPSSKMPPRSPIHSNTSTSCSDSGPACRKGQPGFHQRVQTSDRFAGPSRPPRGGSPVRRQTSVARTGFHRREVREDVPVQAGGRPGKLLQGPAPRRRPQAVIFPER